MTSLSNSLSAGAEPQVLSPVGGEVSDFFALLKPRVMVLVIFTALVGMSVSQGHVQPAIGAISLFAIAVGAAAPRMQGPTRRPPAMSDIVATRTSATTSPADPATAADCRSTPVPTRITAGGAAARSAGIAQSGIAQASGADRTG